MYMNYEIIYDEDINQYPLELDGYKIVYHNNFEIVDLAGGGNQRGKINGKQKYNRMLIKPIFKLLELTGEVIDEQTKTIHKCHPFYTQTIAEQIIEQKMNATKQKNYRFNGEEIEVLRLMVLCLRKQNDNILADEIEEQYLTSHSFNPQSYQDMLNKYIPLINTHIKEQEIKRITPIYKLRNEILPKIN